jgi:hypothetical protein
VAVERATDAAGPWGPIVVEREPAGDLTTALDATAVFGATYFYRLNVHDRQGAVAVLGLVSARRVGETLRPILDTPTPNPAREGTQVSFRVPRAQDVQLTVVDVRGRAVRTLAAGRFAAGPHVRPWDGRTDRGDRAPAGVYFVRLGTVQGTLAQRVTLLR